MRKTARRAATLLGLPASKTARQIQPEEKEWETIQGPAARRIWRGLRPLGSSTRSLEIRNRGSTAALRSAAPQLKIRRHPDALLNRNRQTRAAFAVHARRLQLQGPRRATLPAPQDSRRPRHQSK